jgi:hypothetical protein
VVGGGYRAPDEGLEILEKLERFCGQSGNINSAIVIGGDFNLPSIDWERNELIDRPQYGLTINQKMLDIANDFGLTQVVQEPTRDSNILDIFLIRPIDIWYDTGVVPGISDHGAVIFDMACQMAPPDETREIVLYNKADTLTIRTALQNEFASFRVENIGKDVETMWDSFKNLCLQVVDTYVPKKTLKNNPDPIWYTKNINRLKRNVRKAYACRKKSEWHKSRFKQLERKLIEAKLQEHSHYVKGILTKRDGNKAFYSYLKRKKRNGNVIPTLKAANGNWVESGSEKANLLNSFYASVFTAPVQFNNNETGIGKMPPQEPCYIPITELEILLLLRKINANKACGPDGISLKLLKLAPSEFAPYLAEIFNASLEQATLPREWKQAIVIPIYKKGARCEASNYRPVSLTSSVCKLMECLVSNRLRQHLESTFSMGSVSVSVSAWVQNVGGWS